MAEQFDEQDEQDDVTDEAPEAPNLKKLRDAAKRGEKAAAELATLRLELAATRANIDSSNPLAQRLLNSYDGEMTPEALTKFFTDLGADSVFIKPTTEPVTPSDGPTDSPTITDTERIAADARKALSGGAVPDGASDSPDPWNQGLNAFQDAMAKGEDRRTAAGAAFQHIFAAAHDGDPRVLARRND